MGTEHSGIYHALAAAVDDMPDLIKDSTNPHFKNTYISLDKVLATVVPVLKEHGLFLMQPLTNTGPEPALTTRFVHLESGEFIETTTPLVLEKNTPQAVGSAITYFRRYAILSALGLVAEEDDDAEGASKVAPARKFRGGSGEGAF